MSDTTCVPVKSSFPISRSFSVVVFFLHAGDAWITDIESILKMALNPFGVEGLGGRVGWGLRGGGGEGVALEIYKNFIWVHGPKTSG